ncbi:AraC family transcriptional regulator [Nocardia sp. NPDC051832]|uniref:AraC family transcriptional regulator n=1 Tax=Nocardia sp. NPDC051832 TaxID=3155673 RepID=UPI00342BD176
MSETRWSGGLVFTPGLMAFTGEIGDTAAHSHAAVQILLVTRGEVALTDAAGRTRTAQIAIIPPGTRHAVRATAGTAGLLAYLDPDSIAGRAAIARLQGSPVGDVASWIAAATPRSSVPPTRESVGPLRQASLGAVREPVGPLLAASDGVEREAVGPLREVSLGAAREPVGPLLAASDGAVWEAGESLREASQGAVWEVGDPMREASAAVVWEAVGVRRQVSHAAVSDALRLAAESSSGPPSLVEMAALVGLSPSRLSHVFAAHMGLPYVAWRRWMRLRRAMDAVRGGASLTEAAHAAGFADSAHLTRTCRDMFGITPTDALRATGWRG